MAPPELAGEFDEDQQRGNQHQPISYAVGVENIVESQLLALS
jgi:hypothetical protein